MSIKANKQIDWIARFQNYLLIEKGLSDNSIFSYVSDLKKFKQHLMDKKSLLNVQPSDIKNFIKKEKKQKLSSRTLAREIATLRHFYKYLDEENIIEKKPTDNIENPEIKKHLPEFLTLEEVNILLATMDTTDRYELRDKAIFELLYSSGLRISELCNLSLDDLDMENMFLRVKGKGDRERLVPVGEKCLVVLKQYLKDARPLIKKNRVSNYLFLSKKSDHLNRKSVWHFLHKYLDRTNIKKNITPHTFRHSFATHLLENNADLRSVQELLGHVDITTTQIYTHLNTKTLKNIHKKFHPRS